MGLFDAFKKKKTAAQNAKAMQAKNERCDRCIKNIPANQINKGTLNETISWEIIDNTLYISGKGTLTQESYLAITAPAPRYETITYRRVLPWAVCPGIRESKYIAETCPVAGIPNYINRVVVIGEISGLKEFLLNSKDDIGVKLQSVEQYFK